MASSSQMQRDKMDFVRWRKKKLEPIFCLFVWAKTIFEKIMGLLCITNPTTSQEILFSNLDEPKLICEIIQTIAEHRSPNLELNNPTRNESDAMTNGCDLNALVLSGLPTDKVKINGEVDQKPPAKRTNWGEQQLIQKKLLHHWVQLFKPVCGHAPLGSPPPLFHFQLWTTPSSKASLKLIHLRIMGSIPQNLGIKSRAYDKQILNTPQAPGSQGRGFRGSRKLLTLKFVLFAPAARLLLQFPTNEWYPLIPRLAIIPMCCGIR
ncbi:hypothetical protein VP01_1923g1 [Puccinia sorghi]|uniref:Uncharacterized protein n=1 Tax=Puccinia sorghi TaxID=27349 RepID=A0A0L6VCN2_9BASI|nr:hypothetical protein VP01_1923g1 [Puccinia sorghi]